MTKFILASQSSRRAELLRQLGLEFEILPSKVDENSISRANPRNYVRKLAQLKARTVAKQFKEGVIIGADTMVLVDGHLYGKPKDKEDAIKTLNALDGKVHKVISGVCVINKYSGKSVTKIVTTQVKFRKLNHELINWYVGTGEPFEKAGSYAIQGKGSILIEWVKGDFYNVMGLPLFTLATILEEMNIYDYSNISNKV